MPGWNEGARATEGRQVGARWLDIFRKRSREMFDKSVSRGAGGSRKRETERDRESKLDLMESFDGFA